MILAVDFDGTIRMQDGTANKQLIRMLRTRKRYGDIVILWSCRMGKSLEDAINFCRENGLSPNYVNQNAPEVIARMRGDPRKIYADVYIDDKKRKINTLSGGMTVKKEMPMLRTEVQGKRSLVREMRKPVELVPNRCSAMITELCRKAKLEDTDKFCPFCREPTTYALEAKGGER